MAKPPEKVVGELLIRFEGSSELNRIGVFEVPITARQISQDPDAPGMIEFESRTLVRTLIATLKKLI